MNKLYRTKRCPRSLGDLNRLLLTFGVYRDSSQPFPPWPYLDILRDDESRIHPVSRLGWLTLQHNHMIGMLLQFPAWKILAWSGWQVTPIEQERYTNDLGRWMQSCGNEIRQSVYHAAKTLACIREHSTNGQHEPMTVLLASLIMWAYIELGDFSTLTSSIAMSDIPRSWTLRFDHRDGSSQVEEWIRGNPNIRPYLAGVGNLHDFGSISSLCRECLRLLSTGSRTSWPVSAGMAKVFEGYYTSKKYEQKAAFWADKLFTPIQTTDVLCM